MLVPAALLAPCRGDSSVTSWLNVEKSSNLGDPMRAGDLILMVDYSRVF